MRIYSKVIFLLLLAPFFVQSEEKKKSSKEDFNYNDISSNIQTQSQKKTKTLKPYEDLNDAKVDVKKTKEQILAIDLILKNDKQVDAKVDLYIKKSYLLYSLGKKTKFNETQTDEKNGKEFAQYFDQSLVIVNQLLGIDQKKSLLSNSQKAMLYFIRGSIYFELNKEDEMLKEYLTSLSFNKSSAQASSISLILGEYYFDKNKFDDAIQMYQSIYNIYDSQQKAIADYKTAWCYLIKKDYQKSQDYFVRGIFVKTDHSLVEDSIKDLAYVSTQVRNEEQNLDFSKKTFRAENLRALYLLALIRHMHAIDKKQIPYQLFNEAFKLNKSSKDRYQIIGLLISFERREYPTKGQIVAFDHLLNLVKKTKPEEVKDLLKEARLLPDDLEYYIKIFIDGYLQKIQARKITDSAQFTSSLNKMIPFYIQYFGNEKNLLTYYSLWIDIGRKEEDLKLLEQIRMNWDSRKSLYTSSDLDSKIDNRLRLEIITLMEKKPAKDLEIKNKLFLELVGFAQKFPNDINILPISKRISESYLSDSKYKEALPYLKTIYNKEPSAETFYNLKLATFQLGDLETLTNDPDIRKYENDPKVIGLIREARLKQAASYYEKNNFDKYEENIKTYLDSKPDEKKSLIVYSDYFSKLLDRKQGEKFCNEYTQMDKKIRNSKEILKYVETYIDQILGENSLFECAAFEKFTEDPTVDFKISFYLRTFGKPITELELLHLKKTDLDKRKAILSLMSLVQPLEAIQYFHKYPPQDKDEKKFFLISYRISQKSDRPTVKDSDLKILQELMPEENRAPIGSKIDKQISQFFYPKKTQGLARYSKIMEDVFYRIKVLRRTFVKESSLMPDAQKMDFLVKLSEVEKKVAQVIIDSPKPTELTEEQMKQYDQELLSAAQGYLNQSDEYVKLREAIQKAIDDKKTFLESQRVPEINIEKWFWPTGSMTETVKSILKDRGPYAALVYTEYQKNAGKIKDNDFYNLRAGILLTYSSSETMRNYVRDELNSQGLSSTVEQWRKLK